MSLSLEIEAWRAGPGSPWRNVLIRVHLSAGQWAAGGNCWGRVNM